MLKRLAALLCLFTLATLAAFAADARRVPTIDDLLTIKSVGGIHGWLRRFQDRRVRDPDLARPIRHWQILSINPRRQIRDESALVARWTMARLSQQSHRRQKPNLCDQSARRRSATANQIRNRDQQFRL